MHSVCRHCENRIDGIAYRVLSQDNGSILLDMIDGVRQLHAV